MRENKQSLFSLSLSSRATSGQHLDTAWKFQHQNEQRKSAEHQNQSFTTKSQQTFVSVCLSVRLCHHLCVLCISAGCVCACGDLVCGIGGSSYTLPNQPLVGLQASSISNTLISYSAPYLCLLPPPAPN